MRYKHLVTILFLSLSWALPAQVSEMESTYLKLADQYEQRDKNVVRDLRNYLKEYPFTTYEDEVYFMLSIAQTEKGLYKQALKDFERVDYKVLARPHQPQFLFYRGYANQMLQEFDRASVFYALLLKNDNPYKQKATYYYSYCQYRLGHFDKALPGFEQLENVAEYQKTIPFYLVQIYYAQGNHDAVIERAERLLAAQSDNENASEIHRILGEIYYGRSEWNRTIEHLSYYLDHPQEGTEPLRNDIYLLGIAEYNASDYASSVTHLKRVTQVKDTIAEAAYLTMGNAYVRLGETERAKLNYQGAMQLHLTAAVHEEAMYNYTLTTFQSSTALGESVNAFTDFLKQYPESHHREDIMALLSDALLRSKNYQAALSVLDSLGHTTRQMNETKQYLRYQLGTDAFVQGRMPQAKEWLTAVIDHAEGENYRTEAYYWRAEAEYRLHEYDEAKQDVRMFLSMPKARTSDNYLLAAYLNAYIDFTLGDYTEAERQFAQYVQVINETDPTYSDAFNRMGDCSFNDRRFEQAIQYYARVINSGANSSDYALFQKGYSEGLLRRVDKKLETMQQLLSRYPKSDYADNGLYEMARTYLQRDNNSAAIQSYEQLLKQYPHSDKARAASLELAMLYRSTRDYDKAIAAYKQTITRYPNSEEAYSALDGLEATYVETNRIAEYLAYTKELGKLNMNVSGKEDSLSFAAAELQYMLGNYPVAAASLTTYLSQYCAGGRYCMVAQYYAADCYYRLEQRTEALAAYKALAGMNGNPYMEEACMRVAELSFDKSDYTTALDYFYKMLSVASTRDNANIARLGILRCCSRTAKHQSTIDIASQILHEENINSDTREEALYNRAKAYIQEQQFGLAIADLTPLATDVQTAIGAEAKYLLAECYFNLHAMDNAEEEIMSFAQMKTQQQYWLARALILLSDVNRERGEYFQARQYLLSLQSNYRLKDDIQDIITNRLSTLDKEEPSGKEDVQ